MGDESRSSERLSSSVVRAVRSVLDDEYDGEYDDDGDSDSDGYGDGYGDDDGVEQYKKVLIGGVLSRVGRTLGSNRAGDARHVKELQEQRELDNGRPKRPVKQRRASKRPPKLPPSASSIRKVRDDIARLIGYSGPSEPDPESLETSISRWSVDFPRMGKRKLDIGSELGIEQVKNALLRSDLIYYRNAILYTRRIAEYLYPLVCKQDEDEDEDEEEDEGGRGRGRVCRDEYKDSDEEACAADINRYYTDSLAEVFRLCSKAVAVTRCEVPRDVLTSATATVSFGGEYQYSVVQAMKSIVEGGRFSDSLEDDTLGYTYGDYYFSIPLQFIGDAHVVPVLDFFSTNIDHQFKTVVPLTQLVAAVKFRSPMLPLTLAVNGHYTNTFDGNIDEAFLIYEKLIKRFEGRRFKLIDLYGIETNIAFWRRFIMSAIVHWLESDGQRCRSDGF